MIIQEPLLTLALALLWSVQPMRAAETVLVPTPVGIHDAILEDLGRGEWEVRTTGTDPYLFVKTRGEAVDLHEQPIFGFEYFSAKGVGRMLVFVGSAIDIPHMVTLPDLGRSEGWAKPSVDMTATPQVPPGPVTSLRITLGDRPGIVARLRSLCARPPTEQEQRLAADRAGGLERDRQHAERLRAYLTKSFQNQVTSVSAGEHEIAIKGRVSEDSGELFCAEIPMWEDVTALEAVETALPVKVAPDGSFVATVARRTEDGRDRLLSAWALVRKSGDRYEAVSSQHYVDAQTFRAELPPARPRSLKGLGGCPFTSPDMEELGIASVTLNVVLNDIIFAEPGANRTSYRYAGRTWYIDDRSIAGYDRSMQAAAEHGWMVSAIILLRPVGNAPSGSWIRDAAHPDADPSGIFVMPNFTSRAGVEAFAAAMNFVADRYSRPDGKFGRIHHWIMHNEVNSGFFWTSAGTKTVVTYLELYQKSLRLAALIAGQYDPHSKPLISLDHCWTKIPDIRSYAARELLDLLVDFSRREGDFPWAIAFHPYPQDLFNPRTWEDSEAAFDFRTPYITFRNIEVLDAWCRQPRVAFRGAEPREIQLTEQGLNSRDYRPQSLAEQAAGMAYAWKKIEPLTTITAFQYHLWADERSEGGLRLGLRKFSDDSQDPLGKKDIWHLYQAIGTGAWEEASRFAKPIIGIHDWSEVQYRGPIQ